MLGVGGYEASDFMSSFSMAGRFHDALDKIIEARLLAGLAVPANTGTAAHLAWPA
jgi:hypothetical protein